ncbi:MAG TPA: DUF349 domain-containing protein [Cyclobacteriaceae bacterium]|nr:DUF349 domain-containing protein [Cyclobacteriaceae bacterium]
MNKATGNSEVEEKIVSGDGLVNEEANSPVNSGEVTQEKSDTTADDQHEHPEEHHEDELSFDLTGKGKSEMLLMLKDLLKEDNFKRIDLGIKELKSHYDELQEQERKLALEKFVAEGGAEADFDYRADKTDIDFDANYKLLKDRRNKYFKELEEKKSNNLVRKQEVLEKLRAFVDAEETNISFDNFKKLQEEWKSIGNVPAAQARSLWANYKALVDRFYDNRSIYFELKELDRKKNLDAKLELCQRAENLNAIESLKDAVKELNELHHEFKHVGPVPADEQEAVWQRFKAASDAIYAKRDAFVADLQKELNVHLETKRAICNEIAAFADFNSDRIKDWNQKTKEVLELQKKWEAAGAVPRSKAKDINKKFWSAFKQFFNNKGLFFKKLDHEREANLKLKQELVQQAEALKESKEWEKAAAEFKALQNKWREIGPVPERLREKIYADFKAACDYFFVQRRTVSGEKDQEFKKNLESKQQIVDELKKLAAEGTGTPDQFKNLAAAFEAEGFVPRKHIQRIRQAFNEAVEVFMNSLTSLSEADKNMLMVEVQMMGLKNDPRAKQKLIQKEQIIRKKIQKVENDLAVWKNNLEFFAHSKNADKFKDEFNGKIEDAAQQLTQLKHQLKILRMSS